MKFIPTVFLVNPIYAKYRGRNNLSGCYTNPFDLDVFLSKLQMFIRAKIYYSTQLQFLDEKSIITYQCV